MSHTEFDLRMKRYEKSYTDINLMPRCPVIIRLDGKSFHTYTKQFKDKLKDDPFSDELHDAFIYASIKTANHISGCRAIFTQSDEVSIWLDDKGRSLETTGWYGYDIQKLVSVSSSIFTAYFNEKMECDNLAFFDSRTFSLPDETELNNYFIYRQQDATRNSISMIANHNFSHKSLHGVSTNEMQERLFQEKGINWNDLPTWKKRGSLIVKKSFYKDAEFINKNGDEEVVKDVKRHAWEEVDCPQFTKENIIKIAFEAAQNPLQLNEIEIEKVVTI